MFCTFCEFILKYSGQWSSGIKIKIKRKKMKINSIVICIISNIPLFFNEHFPFTGFLLLLQFVVELVILLDAITFSPFGYATRVCCSVFDCRPINVRKIICFSSRQGVSQMVCYTFSITMQF